MKSRCRSSASGGNVWIPLWIITWGEFPRLLAPPFIGTINSHFLFCLGPVNNEDKWQHQGVCVKLHNITPAGWSKEKKGEGGVGSHLYITCGHHTSPGLRRWDMQKETHGGMVQENYIHVEAPLPAYTPQNMGGKPPSSKAFCLKEPFPQIKLHKVSWCQLTV